MESVKELDDNGCDYCGGQLGEKEDIVHEKCLDKYNTVIEIEILNLCNIDLKP